MQSFSRGKKLVEIGFALALVFPIFVVDPAKADLAITISTKIFGAGVATNVGVSLSGFDGTQRYQVTATSTEG